MLLNKFLLLTFAVSMGSLLLLGLGDLPWSSPPGPRPLHTVLFQVSTCVTPYSCSLTRSVPSFNEQLADAGSCYHGKMNLVLLISWWPLQA